jgi:ribonuclease PH
MRPVSFERRYLKYPAGSCLAVFGETKVICTCIIEPDPPPFLSTGGWVTAEYAMLPASVGRGRKRRELAKRDGRSVEIQRLIGRSLRAAVNLETLPPVSLVVDCDVIQADGGTRTAAISGGWVALRDALDRLAQTEKGASADRWLLGQVGAVSVGIVDGAVICDLDYAHDSRAEVDMNVVKRDGELVEIQGTGEKGTFSRARLDELLDAAEEGIDTVMAAQRKALSG